ncbi:hypothetical protein [Streptomyces parvulus]|uniref:hypothetical protein n=1 Tax=Streptomyces parvulus TaxID=146923 RepID=UPI0033EE2DFB
MRAAAGIDFPGTPSTVLGWRGDVTLDRPPRPGFSVSGPYGGLVVAPLPGGRFRLVGLSPDGLTTEWPGDLTLDELRQRTAAIAGEDFGLRDLSWSRTPRPCRKPSAPLSRPEEPPTPSADL